VDRDLVRLAQRGDRDAFAILARSSADRLFAIARRILRDVDRSEDAVQQTLVIAWRELPRLRDPDRFDGWLNRLVVHACYDEARRTRRWTAKLRTLSIDEATSPDDLIGVVERDRIDRALRRLAPEQRAVLVLRHYLGLDLAEIAETLGIPAGTARSRLHYAHRAMRAALDAVERTVAAAGERP
jgi:RNA polymerase sigma-70 factor (ECF subfamily)